VGEFGCPPGVGFLAKPTHIVDDQHITEWRDLKHLHPNEDIPT